ncbi:MAG: 2-hydroxyacyl-CoA dehydratase [Deltaproteobacteria bacterium]|nr:2-hydroxyacyl-CoA dehydratase [Deltaproteobacteria bacterium]MBW1919136.1 2-hydroxyacyl-CoA dehydratase [Deltaproteobacteria bacterium]MBW1934253.1 2-hydroxyacyl-CoA dehydratase [Deltaproteobacteria bacterium]MBW1977840.1 2-hydroxyacyl-CoA dehydratase [Deltaproteobacteria bacterium]MBW2044636.1 2-hydroxyacyl-CoA dehydratase [Deltaproteobacteria bacterium]
MPEYYDRIFGICGFQDTEIERERSRIERALDKIGVGPEDIPRVEQRLREQHEVELEGVRKILRAWILELLDLVLAKEEGKTVIYYGYPSIQGPGMAISSESGENVYVGCPDVVLCHTVGLIFDKLAPFLEAAETNGLPPGHGLCSLQQIRNGGLALGVVPVPDLVIASSYYCDMGSKADELLHEIYGHPAVYIDGSMDSRWGEFPRYDLERIRFLGGQLDKLFANVEKILGIEVTRRSMKKAMATSRVLYSALGQLTSLMTADPMPISGVVSGIAMNLAAASTGRSMSEGPDALSTLCKEVEGRVKSGYGILEKGAPRVLNFAHSFSDPGITHMIEKAGLALAASFVTVPPGKRDKSLKLYSLGEELAESAMRGGAYHSTYGFAKRFAEAARSLSMDGVIWGYQYNCRPMALGSHLFKQFIEEETGIPTLSLEMDYYESRTYGAEALRTKVETFAEMLRARKAKA